MNKSVYVCVYVVNNTLKWTDMLFLQYEMLLSIWRAVCPSVVYLWQMKFLREEAWTVLMGLGSIWDSDLKCKKWNRWRRPQRIQSTLEGSGQNEGLGISQVVTYSRKLSTHHWQIFAFSLPLLYHCYQMTLDIWTCAVYIGTKPS